MGSVTVVSGDDEVTLSRAAVALSHTLSLKLVRACASLSPALLYHEGTALVSLRRQHPLPLVRVAAEAITTRVAAHLDVTAGARLESVAEESGTAQNLRKRRRE